MLNLSEVFRKLGDKPYSTKHAHMPRRILANNSGVSFIDLMLALVVLAIGVLALADLQVISSRGNTFSKSMRAAISLAETQIETIKGAPYGTIVTSGPTQVTDSGVMFTQQVQVTNDSPVANVKTVKVIVTWTDQAGITHTVPMSTIIAQ